MLQVVIPGLRNGHSYKAGENLLQGTVAYISGMHTDGYFLLKNPRTSTTAAMSIYPFMKSKYQQDLTDYGATAGAGEVISSGDPLICFEGGEYITDRYISVVTRALTYSTAAIGSHTSTQFFMDNIWIDSATNPQSIIVTDTAAYSEGGGRMVYLWPCTAAANKGWLRIATAGDILCSSWAIAAAGGSIGKFARYNRNFLLTKTWNRGHLGFNGNAVQFRVVGRDAFQGRYWTSVTTAAIYNANVING